MDVKKSEKNNLFENFYELKKNGTDIRTEIIAGITTFLTMAYVLAVIPGFLKELEFQTKDCIHLYV